MENRDQLYLATTVTDRKIVVLIKNSRYERLCIGAKKRRIVRELNEKLGGEFIKYVKFYGYADVDNRERFLKRPESIESKQNEYDLQRTEREK